MDLEVWLQGTGMRKVQDTECLNCGVRLSQVQCSGKEIGQ